MKRILSMILLVASCLVLIVSIIFCVYSIADINRILNELANDPSASGIDYFGIGWGYGICLFAVSVLGFILSWISKKLLQQKILRYITIAAMAVFALLFIISIFTFCM
ncbi:MAG: hypothetical protein IKJ94_04880 [Oscillospiraceae bacterium]|nr:hypothetical protein [Oscillospiraceae bacterium]